MPTASLTSTWLWLTSPRSRNFRSVSRSQDTSPDHEEEERILRRARSCSSARSQKVFSTEKSTRSVSRAPSCSVTSSPSRGQVCRTSVSTKNQLESGSANTRSVHQIAEDVRSTSLQVIPPDRRALPGRTELLTSQQRTILGLDCDEVLPGLVLATGKTVKCLSYMKELRAALIINTASRDVWLPVEKLTNMGAQLFQFHVDDVPSGNLAPYFRVTADLIHQARQTGGLVVVNCLVGISRSATILIASLMILNHWTLMKTLKILRRRRQVKPNLGFMAQLVKLEMELQEKGILLS